MILSLIQKYSPKNTQDYENALKEVIQEITLAALSRAKFFDKAAFYGGTALRIFYGLTRFSEDLDFTLLKPDPAFKLKPYFSAIQQTLESFGLEVTLEEVQKSQNRNTESAFLKANTQMHLIKVQAAHLARQLPSNKLMHVKFEVDVQAPSGFETEIKPLLPPITASVNVLKPSSLFAGKMHAVLFRNWKGRIKGRDYYDLLWYLGQGIPVNLLYLEQKMNDSHPLERSGPLTRAQLLQLLAKKIDQVDWEKAKLDIVSFIPDREEVSQWSREFFLAALSELQCLP